MKKSKKIIAVVLAVIILISTVSVIFCVSNKGEPVSDVSQHGALSIEVITSKSEYRPTDIADITVKVTNTSDETVNNVSAEAVLTDLVPLGRKSQTNAQAEKLEAGQSIEFRYKATLNPNYSSLSGIQRFFLKFKRLFYKKVNTSNNEYNDERYCSIGEKTIVFGDYKISNKVIVHFSSDIEFSVNQKDIKTKEGTFTLSGKLGSTKDIIYIEYITYADSDNGASSFKGCGVINENTWKIDFVHIKPGNNKIFISALTTSGMQLGHIVNATYDMGKPFDIYDKNHIKKDTKTNKEYIDNLVTVIFNYGVSYERIEEIIAECDGEEVGRTSGIYDIRVKEMNYSDLEAKCNEFERFDEVLSATVKTITKLTPDVIKTNDPWGGDKKWEENYPEGNNWGFEAIQAPSAWEYNYRFSHIDIGVVDSGFDLNHEDFEGVFKPSSDYQELRNNYKRYDEKNKKEIDESHGTHVAGVIGATANNKKGITGLLWNTNICYTDWQPNEYKDDQPSWDMETAALVGVYNSVKSGAKVVNLSCGEGESFTLEQFSNDFNSNKASINSSQKFKNDKAKLASAIMLRLLEENHDFLVVQSAGNGVIVETQAGEEERIAVDTANNGFFASVTEDYINKSTLPEKYKRDILDRIIVVGAAEIKDGKYQQCDFSNGGSRVDICAPGRNIYSSYVKNKYGEMSGTSMAAPHVTGVCGMVWAVNPEFTGAQVKEIVCSTKNTPTVVNDNPDENHPLNNTYRLLNAKLAVEDAIRRSDKNTVSGTVKNAEQEVIKGANINIIRNDGTMGRFSATSDNGGNFSVKAMDGTYNVIISKSTYKPKVIENVTVSGGEVKDLGNIELVSKNKPQTVWLEPTKAEWEELEDIMGGMYFTGGGDFDSDSSDSILQFYNSLCYSAGPSMVYSRYFSDKICFGRDETGNWIDEAGKKCSNSEADPLNRFNEEWSTPYKLPAKNIDWIIRNIFNVEPNHNISSNNDDANCYYYGDWFYLNGCYGGDAFDPNPKIQNRQKQANGMYHITGDCYAYEGSLALDDFDITAGIKEIDGKRYWSFTKIKYYK